MDCPLCGTILFLFLFVLICCDGEPMQLAEKFVKRVSEHPFFKHYRERGVREGLFSDMVGALGRMHDTVVKCAYPELIGRNIIAVRPTEKSRERFPLDHKAVGYSYAEGTSTRLSGAKNGAVEVNADIIAEASECWTYEFVEDSTWNVMENMVEKVGRALGQEETSIVLSLYGNIANSDLAGAVPIDQGDRVMDWKAVIRLYDAVRGENWRPNILVLHETQLHQLLEDDKFIDSRYLTSLETDVEYGLVRSALSMRVQASTLVPNGTAYAIDTRVAAIMLLRRDIAVKDWSDPRAGEFGIKATTRFGLGVLRSNAIAKMVNIKTSL